LKISALGVQSANVDTRCDSTVKLSSWGTMPCTIYSENTPIP
jgi:hypothetical protein